MNKISKNIIDNKRKTIKGMIEKELCEWEKEGQNYRKEVDEK